MKKKWVVFIILVVIICSAFYVVTQTTFFSITTVIVNEEASHFKSDDFKALLGLNLITTPKETMRKGIESDPYVLDFKVQSVFPSTLKLTIVERQEFAAIKFHELFIIIDLDGIVLDIRREPGELLILDGFDFESVHLGEPLNSKKKDTLAHAIQLMLLLKQNVSFPYQVTYRSGIEVQLTEQMRAKFGEGEDIENQFVAFMTIYEDIVTKGITSGVIDVSKKDYYIFKPIDG